MAQGHLSRKVVYRTSVSILVTASRFLAGNNEAELKPTTFSSILLFIVFLFSLSLLPLLLPSDTAP